MRDARRAGTIAARNTPSGIPIAAPISAVMT